MSETPDSSTLFGVAKKLTKELEELPLHTHAAVISLMNSALQHRQIALQADMQQKQADAQREVYEQAERRQALKESGLVLA